MKIIIIIVIHLLVSYKCLIVNCLVNYIQWKSAKKSKFEKKSSSHETLLDTHIVDKPSPTLILSSVI